MQSIEEVFNDMETRMTKTINSFKNELLKVRTGRANPSILEGITVNYYDTQVPLNQVATIGAPEPRLLIVQPWDKTIIGEIERVIRSSGLGLNPINDGNVIRIPIPPLSEERRNDLVKLVKKFAEEARVAIRNIRRDGIDVVRKLEKDGKISEDESQRAQDRIQEIHDKYIEKINSIAEKKEKEILEE